MEDRIEALMIQLEQWDMNFDDNLNVDEIRILVKLLERVEKENEKLARRIGEMAE